MKEKKNILIADTQFLVVEALKTILADSYTIAGIAENTYELYKLIENQKPDLLITDVSLIDYTGIEELLAVKSKCPGLSIVVLNNHFSATEISALNKIGIKNMVFKTAEKDEIINAIEAALKGKKYYCSEVLDLLLESQDKKASSEEHSLTQSELEIVKLIAEGLTTKEIAEKRNLSFHTVMTHRKNIFRKANVNNASELLMYAMRKGLFDLEYYI